MAIILTILLVVCIAIIVYQFLEQKKKNAQLADLQRQLDEIKKLQIPDKDLQFLEFTVDMYIKYAKDLNIHSKDQHEYLSEKLEEIRKKYLVKN